MFSSRADKLKNNERIFSSSQEHKFNIMLARLFVMSPFPKMLRLYTEPILTKTHQLNELYLAKTCAETNSFLNNFKDVLFPCERDIFLVAT